MAPCRLIIDGPGSGSHNMSVDEVLLQIAADQQQPTLRFYSWQPATLSLGYFQKLEDREHHAASRSCEIVRRASGGGAILHDHELTYSFATPSRGPMWTTEQLYRTFHESLVEVLAQVGITARLHDPSEGLRGEAFLCFQRRATGDVTLDGHKIGGSAQRRRKRGVVQHGSVLLQKSVFAPELPGLRELAAFNASCEWLVQAWLAILGERLGLSFQFGSLSADELDAVAKLSKEKFAHASWMARR